MLKYFIFKIYAQDNQWHQHVYRAETWEQVKKVYPQAVLVREAAA